MHPQQVFLIPGARDSLLPPRPQMARRHTRGILPQQGWGQPGSTGLGRTLCPVDQRVLAPTQIIGELLAGRRCPAHKWLGQCSLGPVGKRCLTVAGGPLPNKWLAGEHSLGKHFLLRRQPRRVSRSPSALEEPSGHDSAVKALNPVAEELPEVKPHLDSQS